MIKWHDFGASACIFDCKVKTSFIFTRMRTLGILFNIGVFCQIIQVKSSFATWAVYAGSIIYQNKFKKRTVAYSVNNSEIIHQASNVSNALVWNYSKFCCIQISFQISVWKKEVITFKFRSTLNQASFITMFSFYIL